VLDIRNNAVTASHGATIEKLDTIKLFYMQAKGLSLTQARHMMVDAEVQTLLEPLASFPDRLVDG
jgi:Fe-S cluster assembly scaffold protein SufB